MVALDVGVGVDLVRDLQREQREADSTVEGAGSQPLDAAAAREQPAVRGAPEPHVVPLGRIALHLLLVREVLLVAEQEEGAHRRLVVAAAEQGRGDDAPAAGEGHVVGANPVRPTHGGIHLRVRAVQGQVDGVAEQAVARTRAADEVVRHVDRGQDAVQSRQHQVGEHHPEEEEEEDEEPAPPKTLGQDDDGQPDGRNAAEDEEEIVRDDVRRPGTHDMRPGLAYRRLRHGLIVACI